MKQNITYQETESFSSLINDYLTNSDTIKPFCGLFPDIGNFQKQWDEKKSHQINRSVLVKVLKNQNLNINLSDLSKRNIDRLEDDDAFTITTGHQLCLFTGPLYCIYKIVSTIKLCQQLKSNYPNKNFIPIFWMASEDHDLKEVNHIHLFRKHLVWDTDQTGAVGSMKLDSINPVLIELKKILGNDKKAQQLFELFKNSYQQTNNLAEATRYLINSIFGKYGLVIIDGNDSLLKKEFTSIMEKDLINEEFYAQILDCTERISKYYKPQAYIQKSNFFQLSQGKREKISRLVTKEEIQKTPEIFSPNVLMRPLYQEMILPNLAYIGGGAEIAYWMQLKSTFKSEKIPFPILVLRNSALLLTHQQYDKIKRLGFDIIDIFSTEQSLHKKYIDRSIDKDFNLEKEIQAINNLFTELILKLNDKGLEQMVLAEQAKQIESLKKFSKRIIKSKKKAHTEALNSISLLKNKLFPNQALQERKDNFIPYYLEHGENFIKILLDEFDPLNPNFVILTL